MEYLVVPDERLRQKSAPIESIDNHTRELASNMVAKLGEEYNGQKTIGCAAPQFGVMVRLIAIRLWPQDGPTVLVNPIIVKQAGSRMSIEGCRSIPLKLFKVQRPMNVKVRATTLDNATMVIRGFGQFAAALSHEINHCDGIMIDQIGQELTDEEKQKILAERRS